VGYTSRTVRYELTQERLHPLARCDSAVLDVVAVAGAVALGAWARVPLPFSPVPVTLQTLPVLLAGFAVGRGRATTGLALYLALGLAGAPLFATTVGPTLGYLVAFLGVPYVVERFRAPAAGLVAGTMLIYALGATWLAFWLRCTPAEAMMVGVVPFLPGDVLKIFAAHRVVRWIRR